MNTRIYISKDPRFDISTRELNKQLQQLGIASSAKTYVSYDILNISEQELPVAAASVFTEPVTEKCLFDCPQHQVLLGVELLPGQFDIRADAAMQCCRLLFNHNNIGVRSFMLFGFDNLNPNDLDQIKKHLINPVDSAEKNLAVLNDATIAEPKAVQTIEGLIAFTSEELTKLIQNMRLSIDLADMLCIQEYFKNENRNPTETEIRALDTYWSDHCRHTTFLTSLQNITFKGDYAEEVQAVFEKYLNIKSAVGKENTPITLMELATVLPKYLTAKGKLNNIHKSKENNAATIEVDVDTENGSEKWLLLFKNETHNHPTEIEPFGGAATCIGGAIRDPLSGRAFVYQAMRLSGAGNPLEKNSDTIPSKLPQSKISKEAALGYSSYGNQIGLSTSHVTEIFHEGYKAKRFECGFVIGAVKKENVIEEDPSPGDIVLLIGGDTGKDGIGGASGSSMKQDGQTTDSMLAEVQKGNAVTERKIQRLFRKQGVSAMIKKCNDFGAGGICVAVGEIADSVSVDLNTVPLKYNGLNGNEIALSESQERMAVVVEAKNANAFIEAAAAENLKATAIATVTEDDTLRMHWNGKEIINLKRSFLATNGAGKSAQAIAENNFLAVETADAFSKTTFLQLLGDKNIASQKGMVEHFDSTVLGNTCLMPFGGKYQLSPSDVSAHFICEENYSTNTISMASWGYDAELTAANPFLGGMYAVIESVSKIVAAGGRFQDCYLTFQEYFEKLGNDPQKWGKPLSALLGAFEAQYQLEIAAIGGKDSMSGTFNEINVPPTLVSFAVTTGNANNIISPELKKTNSYLYLYKMTADDKHLPNWNKLKAEWNTITELIQNKKIISAKYLKKGGVAVALAKMSFGNKIGFETCTNENLLAERAGCIVFEAEELIDSDFILIGKTNESTQLSLNGIAIEIEEAINSWTQTFENLFPTTTSTEKHDIPAIHSSSKTIKNIGFGKPTVVLPIFPGTNCEYETAQAFEKEGAIVKPILFNDLNALTLAESIDLFATAFNNAQIIAFSGGFSAGDEPNGSAKFIVNVLKNEQIKNSIHQFLSKDGLMLGICNGFQALIKSGLLPYGEVKNTTKESPTLTFNTIGRHISQMATVKVVNDNSPWLQGMKNQEYIIPFSHGEGRFYACNKTMNGLIQAEQIATQYINTNGIATEEFPFNPNGSLFGVEGIINSTGNIFGRMGHPERFKKDRFKNIPDMIYHNIFKNGVNYFK